MQKKLGLQTSNAAAIAALVLATLFWSGNFIAGRAISGEIAPLELNVIRWTLGLVIMLPFTLRGIIAHHRELLASWRLVSLLGLTGIAAFHTMVYQALALTTAVNCLLILALAPVATVIGGSIWNGFRPSPIQLLGLLISIAGALYLVLAGGRGGSDLFRFDQGKLWMVGAILVFAWYTLLLRRKPASLPQGATLAASVAVALVAMCAVLVFRGVGQVQITGGNLLAILYIAIFASALGFFFWSYGISVIGPERGGQFVHLMPVFGSLLAILLLGEDLAASHFVGAGFILTGLVLVNRKATPAWPARKPV